MRSSRSRVRAQARDELQADAAATARAMIEREVLAGTACAPSSWCGGRSTPSVAAQGRRARCWRDTDRPGCGRGSTPTQFAAWLDEQERWYEHWRDWLDAPRSSPARCCATRPTSTSRPSGCCAASPPPRRRSGIDAAGRRRRYRIRGSTKQDRAKADGPRSSNWPEFSTRPHRSRHRDARLRLSASSGYSL